MDSENSLDHISLEEKFKRNITEVTSFQQVEQVVEAGNIALVNGPTGLYYEALEHHRALDMLEDWIAKKGINPDRVILVNVDEHQDVSSIHNPQHPPSISNWINHAVDRGLVSNENRNDKTGAGVIWYTHVDHDDNPQTLKVPYHEYLPYRSSDVNLTVVDFTKMLLSADANILYWKLIESKRKGYYLALSVDFDAGKGIRTRPTDVDLSQESWLISLRKCADIVMGIRSPGYTKEDYAREQSCAFVKQHRGGYLRDHL